MNLLDTDIVVEAVKKQDISGIISIITVIEFLRGVEDKKRPEAKLLLEESFDVFNLDDQIIEVYCNLYRKLKEQRNLLPDADLIIAATAIAHNLVLETNDAHFLRIKALGLKLK